jgi:hypothetical protein
VLESILTIPFLAAVQRGFCLRCSRQNGEACRFDTSTKVIDQFSILC